VLFTNISKKPGKIGGFEVFFTESYKYL